MPDIIKNIYELNESKEQIISANDEKIEINIVLSQNNNKTGQVKGNVVDINGNKLSGVKAQLISKDETIFLTSISDGNGIFYFNNIKENIICKIFLSMSEKETYESNWFRVVEFFEYKELSFTLMDSQIYSIILGKLNSNQYSIKNVEVALFNVDSNENLTLSSIVRTNDLGEFFFSNIGIGNYLIKIENDQIENISSNLQIAKYSQILQIELNA